MSEAELSDIEKEKLQALELWVVIKNRRLFEFKKEHIVLMELNK